MITAGDFVEGKPTIVLLTRGLHLTLLAHDFTGTSGYWDIDAERARFCKRVVFYFYPPWSAVAYAIVANVTDAYDQNGKTVIEFVDWQIRGTTEANWAQFTNTAPGNRNPAHYL